MAFEDDVKKFDMKSAVVGSILGALGILVALAWKDFIQSALSIFLPSSGNILSQFYAAITMTLVSVFIGYGLVKLSEKSLRETFRRRRSYRVSGRLKVKPI